ncbi:MAG: serine O-acetyltransferase [Pseudomonadota bacterium]|nr:serine O-acetyltransferase [Pseudomonadota bacterium]
MAQAARLNSTTDPIWSEIREEVKLQVSSEPLLASFLHATVLKHNSLEEALSLHLAHKLGSPTLSDVFLREVIDEAMTADDELSSAIRADLIAFRERDPACDRFSLPLLYLKGYQGLQAHRVGHWLWNCGRKELALYLQGRVSEVFGMDIHPAARIGSGILIDHATGIVIGETAVVGDNVSMLHEVTLGGTGKAGGDRHPKVHCGVLIGAGAKILGNVQIGEGAKIAACSVVLEDVPPHRTAAGVPAELVGETECDQPALEMDHSLRLEED